MCVCESLPVPFIFGTVEFVIPDRFRARDLMFLSLSECAELIPGVKLCQKKLWKSTCGEQLPNMRLVSLFSLLNYCYLLKEF